MIKKAVTTEGGASFEAYGVSDNDPRIEFRPQGSLNASRVAEKQQLQKEG